LRFEELANFLPHLIAAVVDARPDGRLDVFGSRAEAAAHFSYAFFNDALHGAAPARVEHSYGVALSVGKDDRQAVGRLDRQEEARCAGDEAIAHQLVFWNAGDAMNEVRVNLAERDQRPRLPFRERPDECGTIAFDGAAGSIFGESKIAGFAGGEGV